MIWKRLIGSLLLTISLGYCGCWQGEGRKRHTHSTSTQDDNTLASLLPASCQPPASLLLVSCRSLAIFLFCFVYPCQLLLVSCQQYRINDIRINSPTMPPCLLVPASSLPTWHKSQLICLFLVSHKVYRLCCFLLNTACHTERVGLYSVYRMGKQSPAR